MKLTVHQLDRVAIIALDGELTMLTAVDCLRKARDVLASAPCSLVAVDLSRVPRIDASGCAALISLRRDVRGRRGKLCLFALAAEVRLVLEVMQVHLILDIAPDLEGAIAALDAQADVSARPGPAWYWSQSDRSGEQAGRRAAS
jgi:anti-anti-sigma factor